MILGKLDLQEAAELDFEVEVFGTAEKASDIRFVIEGDDFDIVCKCKEENGNIKVVVPKLKGILPSGVYESRLECIVGGKIFTPLRESIEFNPSIEFGIKSKGKKEVKEGVKVKVVSEDSQTSKLQGNISKAIKEGYDVVEMNGFNIMKMNDKYCGIVNEKTIIKSDKECDTLSELVESLT